jgi:hypothetical protein
VANFQGQPLFGWICTRFLLNVQLIWSKICMETICWIFILFLIPFSIETFDQLEVPQEMIGEVGSKFGLLFLPCLNLNAFQIFYFHPKSPPKLYTANSTIWLYGDTEQKALFSLFVSSPCFLLALAGWGRREGLHLFPPLLSSFLYVFYCFCCYLARDFSSSRHLWWGFIRHLVQVILPRF